MKFLTKTQKSQLIAAGRELRRAAKRGLEFDPYPLVKLYTPGGKGVWLLAALDPKGSEYAYGLCDSGRGYPYENFMPLKLIEHELLLKGLHMVCDPHFVGSKPLSAYTADAKTRRRIIA